MLIEEYKIYKKEKERLINENKNDFNILTTVLNYHDEVRLHSRMIGSLLDTKGNHYQSDLFLKLFLEEIELANWGLDIIKTSVYLEYRDIDIYITDGKKHLIIENKIWAADQECQIIKYINIIVEENNKYFADVKENDFIDKDKIRVIYLTPRNKKVSSSHILTEKDGDNFISFKEDKNSLKKSSDKMQKSGTINFTLRNYKVWYKKIDYKKNILGWLRNSQDKIKNIENLDEVFNQYINVVKMIHNDFEPNIPTFYDFINDKKNKEVLIEEVFNKQYSDDFRKILIDVKTEFLYKFFRNFENIFGEEYSFLVNVNYEVSKKDKRQKKLIYNKNKCKRWFNFEIKGKQQQKDFGTFYKIDDERLLYIFIGKKYLHYGIVFHENYKIIDAEENSNINNLEYRKFQKIKWFSNRIEIIKDIKIFYNFKSSDFYERLNTLLAEIQENVD